MRTPMKIVLILALLLLPAAMVSASDPWCRDAPGVCVTNITSTAIAVSWTTGGHAEAGSVLWGASPGSLNKVAQDERGPTALVENHHVLITDLAPGGTFYYKIVSGGVTYANGSQPWMVTTGPGLSINMPHFMEVHVRLSDGVTPATGAIVYLKSVSGAIESSFLSKLVTDEIGMVLIDLNQLRTSDLQSYFSWSGNDLFVLADGYSLGFGTYEGEVPVEGSSTNPSLTITLNACGGCFIGGTCYADATPDPVGACGVCKVAQSRNVWSASPANTICRAAVNTCDAPEYCTGDSAACPEDKFAPAATVCQAADGERPASFCAGTVAACVPGAGSLSANGHRGTTAMWSRLVSAVRQVAQKITDSLHKQLHGKPMVVATGPATAPVQALTSKTAVASAKTAHRPADSSGSFVAPMCPETVSGSKIEIPIVVDKVNGENKIGFSVAFDATRVKYTGYRLEGSVLETWADTFACELNEIESRIDCDGASDLGMTQASAATLITFLFDGSVEKGALAMAKETIGDLAKSGESHLINLTASLDEKTIEENHAAIFSVLDLAGDFGSMAGDSCRTNVLITEDSKVDGSEDSVGDDQDVAVDDVDNSASSSDSSEAKGCGV